MRTIKQIAAVREREGDTLYGVANDGSVWEMFTGADKLHWSRLPDLPQEVTSAPGDVQKGEDDGSARVR